MIAIPNLNYNIFVESMDILLACLYIPLLLKLSSLYFQIMYQLCTSLQDLWDFGLDGLFMDFLTLLLQ